MDRRLCSCRWRKPSHGVLAIEHWLTWRHRAIVEGHKVEAGEGPEKGVRMVAGSLLEHLHQGSFGDTLTTAGARPQDALSDAWVRKRSRLHTSTLLAERSTRTSGRRRD